MKNLRSGLCLDARAAVDPGRRRGAHQL